MSSRRRFRLLHHSSRVRGISGVPAFRKVSQNGCADLDGRSKKISTGEPTTMAPPTPRPRGPGDVARNDWSATISILLHSLATRIITPSSITTERGELVPSALRCPSPSLLSTCSGSAPSVARSCVSSDACMRRVVGWWSTGVCAALHCPNCSVDTSDALHERKQADQENRMHTVEDEDKVIQLTCSLPCGPSPSPHLLTPDLSPLCAWCRVSCTTMGALDGQRPFLAGDDGAVTGADGVDLHNASTGADDGPSISTPDR